MKRVVQPVRKSLLDVVQHNLRAAGRITYITRVTYFGEYSGTDEDMEKKMASIIRHLQADYTNVSVTGLLLIYPQYYVHLLEASEDIIYKHFKAICDDKGKDCKFGKSIILPFYHHVHQRFFMEWFHVSTVPPILLDKLESQGLIEIQKQVSNCITKLYTLCEHIANTACDYPVTMKDVLRNLGDRVAYYLPESTVLEFLLSTKTPVFLNIQDYVRMYSTVPFINLYNDTIWPPPRNFTFCGDFGKDNYQRVERYSMKEQDVHDSRSWHQHDGKA